jgi:outer membrane protein TolC
MKRILALACVLPLAACASFSEDRGMNAVASLSGAAVTVLRTPEDEAAARLQLDEILSRRLSADDAVRASLLNNRDLQAAFNALGLSEAQMVEASLPPNPRLSVERIAGAGAVEVEARAAANILALATLPARAEIARDRFAAAQNDAALAVLRTATQTRTAYYRAVAAQSLADFLAQSQSAASAAARLSAKLGEAGTLNKLDQARQQVFYAELSAQLASARTTAASERENLTRAMGLWGDDIRYKLPARLPKLPGKPLVLAQIERDAVARRLDLQSARLETRALAKSYGLTQTTRFINLLDVSGINRTTKENGETIRERGFDAEFEIPIFDFGAVSSRRAEETYMLSVNRLTALAVNARSQARDAYQTYRARLDIARHYQNDVLPLRKIISDESLLRYNAMQIDVFTLLDEARRRIASTMAAIEAERDFWIARTNLGAAVLGGAGGMTAPETMAAATPESPAGH